MYTLNHLEQNYFQYEGQPTDGLSIIIELIMIWIDMNDDSVVPF